MTLLTVSKGIISYGISKLFTKGISIVFKNLFDRDVSGNDFHGIVGVWIKSTIP